MSANMDRPPRMNERLCHPISGQELDRRWTAVRNVMRDRGIDALVMQCSNDFLGGYVRWFSGSPATHAYPRAVIFPLDGLLTVVLLTPLVAGLYSRIPSAAAAFTTMTGSVLLALSLAEGAFGPTAIWNAAHVDEDVQMEIWGQDAEALEKRAHREREFRAAATILAGF